MGRSFDAFGNSRAYLWQGGVMTDLNALIPSNSPLFLLEATGGISSTGEIAGAALVISTGEIHAFLATPSGQSAGNENAAPGTPSRTIRRLRTLPENARLPRATAWGFFMSVILLCAKHAIKKFPP